MPHPYNFGEPFAPSQDDIFQPRPSTDERADAVADGSAEIAKFATWLAARGYFQAAEFLLKQAAPRQLVDFNLTDNLARMAIDLGDLDLAKEKFLTNSHLLPGSDLAAVRLVEFLRDHESNVEAAESYCRHILAEFPESLWLYHVAAATAQRLKDFETATARWKHLITHHPDHGPAYTGAAQALAELGQLAQAKDYLDLGLTIFPNSEDLLRERAFLAQRRLKFEDVRRSWAEYREKFPSLCTGWIHEGRWMRAHAELQIADEIFASAATEFPSDIEIRGEYVLSAIVRNDWETAIERLERHCRDFPDDPAGFIRMVHARTMNGQFDIARQLIEGFLREWPDNSEIVSIERLLAGYERYYRTMLLGQAYRAVKQKNWLSVARIMKVERRATKNNLIFASSDVHAIRWDLVQWLIRLRLARETGDMDWADELTKWLAVANIPASNLYRSMLVGVHFFAAIAARSNRALFLTHLETCLFLAPQFLPAQVEQAIAVQELNLSEILNPFLTICSRESLAYLGAAGQSVIPPKIIETAIAGKSGALDSKVAICFRGQPTRMSVMGLQLHRRLFPRSFLIVAVWEKTDAQLIKDISNYCDEIIVMSDIDVPGVGNINRQIIMSQALIKKAAQIGCEYILLARWDFLFFSANIIQKCIKILADAIAPTHGVGQLIIPSIYTRKYHTNHPSDMLLFGHIEDVQRFWSAPLIPPGVNILPEVHLARNYCSQLKALGIDLCDDRALYTKSLIIRDISWFGVIWLRHADSDFAATETLFSRCISEFDIETMIEDTADQATDGSWYDSGFFVDEFM